MALFTTPVTLRVFEFTELGVMASAAAVAGLGFLTHLHRRSQVHALHRTRHNISIKVLSAFCPPIPSSSLVSVACTVSYTLLGSYRMADRTQSYYRAHTYIKVDRK